MMMTEVKTKMIYPAPRRPLPVCPRPPPPPLAGMPPTAIEKEGRKEGRKAFGRRREMEDEDDEESMVTGYPNRIRKGSLDSIVWHSAAAVQLNL